MTETSPTCAVGPCLAPRATGSMYCVGHASAVGGTRARAHAKLSKSAIVAVVIVAVIAVALIVKAVGGGTGSGSSSSNDAANFIGSRRGEIVAAAGATTALLDETLTAMRHQRYGQFTQIASDAQQLHDDLFSMRDDLMGAPGSYKTDEMAFVDAENELKNACGSVVTWLSNISPGTNAQWQNQTATAIADWNSSVSTLWSEAGYGSAPTIRAK